MKYTIETHGCGYTETLEFAGKVYKKEHEGDSSGTETEDDDFTVQMERNGIADERLLDMIWHELDGSFFAFNMLEIAEEECEWMEG